MGPLLRFLQALAADAWGCDDLPVQNVFGPMEDWLMQAVPSIEKRYPPGWKVHKHLSRLVRNILLSVSRVGLIPITCILLRQSNIPQEELCEEFASYFEGMDKAQLEEMAKSFSFGKPPLTTSTRHRNLLKNTLLSKQKTAYSALG